MRKISLTINSIPREVVVNTEMVLIDLLREELHLTGTKQSCDQRSKRRSNGLSQRRPQSRCSSLIGS